MPDYEKLAAIAMDCGFTHCVLLDISTLEFLQEVRDMCNADKCGKYGTSWSCPPACASLDEMRELISDYSEGILVQTVGDLEDSFDWEGITDTHARHKENFGKMWDAVGIVYPSVLAMGSGTCTQCEACTYPGEPCRYPGRKAVSMEACGLYVSKVCSDNDLAYNYGQNKIGFTSCFIF